MKSEITAAEPVESTTTLSPSGGLTARAGPCPRPNDDESAAKYLFKLSHDVILSLDRVGNILCINQRGVQLTGYSEAELRGANVFELLLLPEDRQVARAMLADVLAGKAREYEVRWKTKDGRVVRFYFAPAAPLSAARDFFSSLLAVGRSRICVYSTHPAGQQRAQIRKRMTAEDQGKRSEQEVGFARRNLRC